MRFNRAVLSLLCFSFLYSGCSKKREEPQDKNIKVPSGTVDRTKVMPSSILDRQMHFSVYLPPGYDTSETAFPVLYLLHGMWCKYTDWVNNGMQSVMDDALYLKKAKPMIVIMPDGLDAFY